MQLPALQPSASVIGTTECRKTAATASGAGPRAVRGAVGEYIAIDWLDGPITEIARVDFAGRRSLMQIRALFVSVEHEGTWRRCVEIRLNRETLQAALDLLDGKPVQDHEDEWRAPDGSPAEAPTGRVQRGDQRERLARSPRRSPARTARSISTSCAA